MDGLHIALVLIFGVAVGMRVMWAWFVESPRMKRSIKASEDVNDKQQRQINELNRQIKRALDAPGVKKVTIKRRVK